MTDPLAASSLPAFSQTRRAWAQVMPDYITFSLVSLVAVHLEAVRLGYLAERHGGQRLPSPWGVTQTALAAVVLAPALMRAPLADWAAASMVTAPAYAVAFAAAAREGTRRTPGTPAAAAAAAAAVLFTLLVHVLGLMVVAFPTQAFLMKRPVPVRTQRTSPALPNPVPLALRWAAARLGVTQGMASTTTFAANAAAHLVLCLGPSACTLVMDHLQHPSLHVGMLASVLAVQAVKWAAVLVSGLPRASTSIEVLLSLVAAYRWGQLDSQGVMLRRWVGPAVRTSREIWRSTVLRLTAQAGAESKLSSDLKLLQHSHSQLMRDLESVMQDMQAMQGALERSKLEKSHLEKEVQALKCDKQEQDVAHQALQLERQELVAQQEQLLAENIRLHMECEDLDNALQDAMQAAAEVEHGLSATTPAAIISTLLDQLAQGRMPSPADLDVIRGALSTTRDMFLPSNLALTIQGLHMDQDVEQNLILQLGHGQGAAANQWTDTEGSMGGAIDPPQKPLQQAALHDVDNAEGGAGTAQISNSDENYYTYVDLRSALEDIVSGACALQKPVPRRLTTRQSNGLTGTFRLSRAASMGSLGKPLGPVASVPSAAQKSTPVLSEAAHDGRTEPMSRTISGLTQHAKAAGQPWGKQDSRVINDPDTEWDRDAGPGAAGFIAMTSRRTSTVTTTTRTEGGASSPANTAPLPAVIAVRASHRMAARRASCITLSTPGAPPACDLGCTTTALVVTNGSSATRPRRYSARAVPPAQGTLDVEPAPAAQAGLGTHSWLSRHSEGVGWDGHASGGRHLSTGSPSPTGRLRRQQSSTAAFMLQPTQTHPPATFLADEEENFEIIPMARSTSKVSFIICGDTGEAEEGPKSSAAVAGGLIGSPGAQPVDVEKRKCKNILRSYSRMSILVPNGAEAVNSPSARAPASLTGPNPFSPDSPLVDTSAGPAASLEVQRARQLAATIASSKTLYGPMLFEQTEVTLARAGTSMQFDAFELATVTGGHPLSSLAYYLLQRSGLITSLKLNPLKLVRFLHTIEAGYLPTNPYHNAVHAADVLQTLHVVLHHGGFVPHYTDPMTLLACYLAAVVHDYEHLGVTNDFLVNTGSDLAIRYNDKAPMENHHLAASFSVMRSPDCNFLAGAPKADVDKLRKAIIDLVLATDMKQHFALLGQFNSVRRHCSQRAAASAAAHASGHDDGVVLTSGAQQPPPPQPHHHHHHMAESNSSVEHSTLADAFDTEEMLRRKSLGNEPSAPLVPLSDQERQLSVQLAFKCSDLGHIAEGGAVHQRWVAALEEEFFRQGDRERAAGLPISPLFDRTKPGVTKSQVGFFEVVALPLFKALASAFPGTVPLLHGVQENFKYWRSCNAATK